MKNSPVGLRLWNKPIAYLQKSEILPINDYPVYDIKQSDGVTLEIWGMLSTI